MPRGQVGTAEAGRGGHPFDRPTPEQLAKIVRDFLLSEAAANALDPTNGYIRWAMAWLGIKPDGLAEWLRGYASGMLEANLSRLF